MIRAIGKFDNRRYWEIDINKARQIYFGTYSHINSIDNLIKNFRIKYRCWKYWHSPITHIMSLSVVAAYEIYLDMEEVDLYQTWKDNNIVEFWKFHNIFPIRCSSTIQPTTNMQMTPT